MLSSYSILVAVFESFGQKFDNYFRFCLMIDKFQVHVGPLTHIKVKPNSLPFFVSLGFKPHSVCFLFVQFEPRYCSQNLQEFN